MILFVCIIETCVLLFPSIIIFVNLLTCVEPYAQKKKLQWFQCRCHNYMHQSYIDGSCVDISTLFNNRGTQVDMADPLIGYLMIQILLLEINQNLHWTLSRLWMVRVVMYNYFIYIHQNKMQGGSHGGRVVTLSPPTSEAGVRFLAQPQVGKLVAACCWSAFYSIEP